MKPRRFSVYIVGFATFFLIALYLSYKLGQRIGVERTLDFMVYDVLEDQGYTVTYHENKIEVLPKYAKAWYHQRSKRIDF